MTRTVETHNIYHLGDNLIHCNYLRRLAIAYHDVQFRHAAHKAYLSQLREVVEDLPSITLVPLEEAGSESIDVWKNRKGGFIGHRLQADWVGFHLEFFDKLSLELGFKTPIQSADDLLFDYPAIAPLSPDTAIRAYISPPVDIIVVNSPPMSGQCANPGDLLWLVQGLMDRGHSVQYTWPHYQGTVSAWGALSRSCKYIIGVATGPMWPTFNVWNKDTCERIIMLDSERINLCPNTTHIRNVHQAMAILSARGLL